MIPKQSKKKIFQDFKSKTFPSHNILLCDLIS